MIKTRRGVYYDLKESPFHYYDSERKRVYYFSSRYRREVFIKELDRIMNKFRVFNEKMGDPCYFEISDRGFKLAYDKAQPTNKLVVDVNLDAENPMDESANG